MNTVKETGGARIGRANATWPFATLTVTPEKLQLNATIIGNLVFKPSDIISLEVYSQFISNGIKINHSVSSYNQHVVFWTRDPEALIRKIEQTGILNKLLIISPEMDRDITQRQTQGGFPIRKSVAIAVLVIWNLTFLTNFFPALRTTSKSPFGIAPQIATGFVFLLALLTLYVESVRKLILKEGRSVDDVKIFLYFLMFITGTIFLAHTLLGELN